MLEALRKRVALSLLPKGNGKAVNTEGFNPYQVLSLQYAGVPVYTDMTVTKAVREGYKISAYVYRAVRTIIQAGSAIPWVVETSDGEPIKDHPLIKVLRNPNPEFSGQDLVEFLIAHLQLVGNALWQPLIVGNQVKEIWPVMPDIVRPIPSSVRGEWLKAWQVTSVDGGQYEVPPSQFVHFMMVDPGNPYWGMGPLMAAARTIDTDNEAQDTQKISMQNRGVTDGVFTHETPLTADQFEEARRQIRENFLAKSRKREPWVLGAGAKWTQMSLTAVEMDYIASRLVGKRDIAGAFGISPIFLGDLEQSSYNNMMEARKALYEDVVIPMLDDIKATLNLRIAPMYGNIIISYDISRIPALREDYTKKVEQAKNLWSMGVPFDQINERLEMGFNEFPGWAQGYLPLTLLPTGSSPAPGGMSKALDLETEEAKTAHWKLVDRRRVGWWGVVSKKIEALYEAEAKAVLKKLGGVANPKSLPAVVARAVQGRKAEWDKVMTAVLSALIEDFGGDIAEDLGANGERSTREIHEQKWVFDPMSAASRAWIVKNAAASVKTILETDIADLKRVILAGWDENLSTAQIGRSIRQFYTDHNAYKAMRVARTEVCKASSFGSVEAARQSKVVKTKRWLTSRDDRVRDEHIAMEGETVGLEAMFSNGLEFPQEPNCRCVVTFQSGR